MSKFYVQQIYKNYIYAYTCMHDYVNRNKCCIYIYIYIGLLDFFHAVIPKNIHRHYTYVLFMNNSIFALIPASFNVQDELFVEHCALVHWCILYILQIDLS